MLIDYGWPGNLRKLEHTVERIVILEDGAIIQPEHLPSFISQRQGEFQAFSDETYSLEELEKRYIQSTAPYQGAAPGSRPHPGDQPQDSQSQDREIPPADQLVGQEFNGPEAPLAASGPRTGTGGEDSVLEPREASRKSRTFFTRSMGRKGLGIEMLALIPTPRTR